MTHDPLCHEWFGPRPAGGIYCVCELIAKVREDMLAKCIAALPHDTHCLDTWYDDKTSECFCESAACDRALRALQERPTPPPLPPSVGVPEKRWFR
jgi:hypothetical protein